MWRVLSSFNAMRPKIVIMVIKLASQISFFILMLPFKNQCLDSLLLIKVELLNI